MELTDLTNWLEAHPVTISVIQWVAIIAIAWIAGVFRLLKKYTRKCKAILIPSTSRCLIEKFKELDGKHNVVRSSFLVDVKIINPTSERVVIEEFTLSYYKNNKWNTISKELQATSLPNRPRQKMGSGIKYMKVFFTNFDDDMQDLTLDGNLSPKEFQNAYILFVSFTHGSFNPKIVNEKIKTRVTVKLTTGESLRSTQWIKATEDKNLLNNWIPEFIDQISNNMAWNHFK